MSNALWQRDVRQENVSFALPSDWALLMRSLSNEFVCDWDWMNSFHLLDHQFASFRWDTELSFIAPLCTRWKEMQKSAPPKTSVPPYPSSRANTLIFPRGDNCRRQMELSRWEPGELSPVGAWERVVLVKFMHLWPWNLRRQRGRRICSCGNMCLTELGNACCWVCGTPPAEKRTPHTVLRGQVIE